MIVKDDRPIGRKADYPYLVVATDRFLSGWGLASNGKSRVAWACRSHDEALKLYRWVSSREEMRFVRIARADGYRVRDCAHFHIYVVDDNHRALEEV